MPDPTEATAALRRLADRFRTATGPAEAAALLEEITREGGTLEALSDVLGAASRWVKDRPDTPWLWQPLALAADEIWQAGTDLTEVPGQLRTAAAKTTRIRSATPRRDVAPAPALPPVPTTATSAPRGR
ncbi:hypothetical protein KNE206_53450 [Kitasatospora sp. NE20-6]|uniref:hypothetical protein n=1 Tax=Kitasatospora sp. NE20-6 TaxID=2859066 RepID=UPI0034DCB20A